MEIAILVIGIFALIFGILGFGLGLFAFIEVKAYKLSTHKVEYVPFDNTPMQGATSSEDIEKFNKKVIEDMQIDELSDLY